VDPAGQAASERIQITIIPNHNHSKSQVSAGEGHRRTVDTATNAKHPHTSAARKSTGMQGSEQPNPDLHGQGIQTWQELKEGWPPTTVNWSLQAAQGTMRLFMAQNLHNS
jgi:hypothetical protein